MTVIVIVAVVARDGGTTFDEAHRCYRTFQHLEKGTYIYKGEGERGREEGRERGRKGRAREGGDVKGVSMVLYEVNTNETGVQ